MIAEEGRFTTGDRKISWCRRHETNEFLIPLGERCNVVFILRWLGAHQAITAASLGNKERVMTLVWPIQRTHKTTRTFDHDNVAVPEMVGFAQAIHDGKLSADIIMRQDCAVACEITNGGLTARQKANMLASGGAGQVSGGKAPNDSTLDISGRSGRG